MKLLERLNPQTGYNAKAAVASGLPLLAIVGSPNVGKSVLFNRMTGSNVTVSNYPGTTVEVSRGKAIFSGVDIEVVDTPGMYSLLPISEEEAVARRLLLNEHPRQVLHVIDAKNLPRMLPMTLQLLEAGLPVVLALNMLDEADEQGITFNLAALSEQLGIPVCGTAGAANRGVSELLSLLGDRMASEECTILAPTALSYIQYDQNIEAAVAEITALIGNTVAISPRAVALLILQSDAEMLELLRGLLAEEAIDKLAKIVAQLQSHFSQPLNLAITLRRQAVVNELVARVMMAPAKRPVARLEWLSRLLMQPLTGLPILALVLYFGIYQFVGVFGGGIVVDFIESTVFGEWINPWLTKIITHALPNIWSALLVGEYGIFTLGITYAIAIVLPIVGIFFFMFAILEDSGYLPRLAMLIDRMMKSIGLNGRAVIPIVLGFGCATMATMVTRVLETKRERIITTLLLALAIPCAAQSGLFLAMLGAVQPYGLLIYLIIVALIFLLVGFLAAQVLPGKKAQFYIELPPLRMPRLANVLTKTYSRLEWYFIEILPMFILASVLLWIGSLTWNGHTVVFSMHGGLLGMLEKALDPLTALIGLPTSSYVAQHPEVAFSGGMILVAGFFRRDFGAAGLWHLYITGAIGPVQVLVAAVTLTLFLPCVAQFMVMKKERGLWVTLAMVTFIIIVAFGVGYLLRIGLEASGMHLILDPTAMSRGR